MFSYLKFNCYLQGAKINFLAPFFLYMDCEKNGLQSGYIRIDLFFYVSRETLVFLID